ncbi:hypothetical protein [Winogradskyella sp.]|uniref:FKBP-type peptidyl-prolyl cis-trans isomerase n=1 Tax=Winogradskyella sp. TaxID=1883156 RepID=UPI0026106684|nr:hypothetical protein [Winogradskyella sp.]
MKLKSFILILFSIVFVVVFISCGEDDDVTVPQIVERDRTEQQVSDDSTLVDFLSTHYYNSSFFESGENHRSRDIEITELMEGESVPDGHTLLIEADALETVEVEFLDVDYKYYVLRLNQGGGEAPNFTDLVSIVYEGTNVVEGDVFDSVATPTFLNLQTDGFNPGSIRAWQYIIPSFNTAESFTNGSDGITNYDNFGLGVMFVPSGLAYFSGTQTGSSYANLYFKFELVRYQERDHDSDGVPSYLENLDANDPEGNDFDVFDDDTDEDDIPNFIDSDDDGDGVPTINEDLDGDGDPTNDDDDNDGIPNYLDEDSTESNEEDESDS